jgi:hypothetical protein
LIFCCERLLLLSSEGFIILLTQMEDETFSIEVLIFATILALYVLASYYINKYEFTFVH